MAGHELFATPLAPRYPWCGDYDEASFREAAQRALDAMPADPSLQRALDAIATAPLAPTVEESVTRARILGELACNIADPGRINQGLKGTCAVTVLETYLAERDAAEYARLVLGLVSPMGVVTLRGGDGLVRDEATLTWHASEWRRNPVSRLFQVAAMELAYPEADYQNLVDGYVDGTNSKVQRGIDLDAFDRLVEQVTGVRWDTLSDRQSHITRLMAKMGFDTAKLPTLADHGMGIIRRSLAGNEATFVTLLRAPFRGPHELSAPPSLRPMPHKVRPLVIDDERGTIDYDDPLDPEASWVSDAGAIIVDDKGRCRMDQADFHAWMVELSYRPQFW